MGFSPSMFVEQVNVLFKNSPYVNFASVFCVLLITLIFWKIQPSQVLFQWMALNLILFACRILVGQNFRKRQTGVREAPFWYLIFVVSSFVSGMLWGALPIIYHSQTILSFQQSLMVNSIAVIFIIALVAGAVIIHAMNKIAMLSFSMPAIFTSSLYLLSLDSQYFALLAVLLLVFFSFLYALQVHFDQRINQIFWRDEMNMISNYDTDDKTIPENW